MVAPAESDAFRDSLRDALHPAYELGRELEGGGMSRVFVAEERALGRTVVVKVLPPDLAAGVNRERFRREIQLAARLQHPHIVPLLSAGEASGSLWYTMPFIEGESLRQRAHALAGQGERFGVREVARVLHDVVEALAYAHARGVVHRDVKPGNVLMLGSHALVTDFGVAKALSASIGHTGTTSVGLAIGTPAYMAPEQLAADPAADHRMDIYAAGLLGYELLAGGSPFAAASPAATMAAQLTRVPKPLHELRPDVPLPLSAAIMRCLEKEPSSRPQTADELLADLERAMSGGWFATSGEREAMAGTGELHTATGQSVSSGPTAAIAPVQSAAETARTLPAVPDVLPSLPGGTRRPSAAVLVGLSLGVVMVLGGAWALSATRGQNEAARAMSTAAAPPAPAATPPAPAPPAAGAPVVPNPAATAAAPLTPRLTREDSLAIAAAVERRLAQEERARRSTAQKEMSPAEVEALKARAWARYADSVSEVVRRQFGPEFSRDIARELRRAAGANPMVIPIDPNGRDPRGDPRGDRRGQGPPREMRVPEGVYIPVLPEGSRLGAGAGGSGAAAASGSATVGGGGTAAVPGAHPNAMPGRTNVTVVTPFPPGALPIVERIASQVAPPKSGVHRVVVLELENSTGRPEHGGTATAATAAIHKALAGMEGYELADANATRLSLAAGLRTAAVAAATRSGAALFGNVTLNSRGQVVYLIQVYDARRGYPRVLRVTRSGDEVGSEMGELAAKVAEALRDWVRWEGATG